MDWNGLWSLAEGSGSGNETPWTASGNGSLDGADLVVDAFDGTWGGIAVTGNVQGQLPLRVRSLAMGSVTLPELAFSASDTGSVNLASLQLPTGMQVRAT